MFLKNRHPAFPFPSLDIPLLILPVIDLNPLVFHKLLNRNFQCLRNQPQITQAVPVSTLTALNLAYLNKTAREPHLHGKIAASAR